MHRLTLLSLLLVACSSRPAPPSAPAPTGEAGAAPPPAGSCEALDGAACGARPDCAVIQAQPHVAESGCAGPATAVGCMSADAACGDAITFARAPDGAAYWFMDTCIPAGWVSEPYPTDTGDLPPSC